MLCSCAGDEVAASKIKLILSTNGEIVRYGWTRGDGRFKIPNVPVGSHLLEVSALGLLYPEVRQTANALVLSFHVGCILGTGCLHS